jgi:hypothetical protein
LCANKVVTSDGLASFSVVTGSGGTHQAKVVDSYKQSDLPEFSWVKTVLGNLITTLA